MGNRKQPTFESMMLEQAVANINKQFDRVEILFELRYQAKELTVKAQAHNQMGPYELHTEWGNFRVDADGNLGELIDGK